jgi:hypothetical protein
MQLNQAMTVAEIRATCAPKPLFDGQLDAFFVETSEARSELISLRDELREQLASSKGARRILVHGHRGCGKSTELNQLRCELGPEWFVVSFSITDFLPMVNVRAEDILLSMAVAIFDHAEKLEVDETLLQKVYEFFAEVTEKRAVDRLASLSGGVAAGIGPASVWAKLLGLKAYFKAELAANSKSEESVVQKVRHRQSELSASLDALIEAVRLALEKDGRKLLIIVEDLDKLMLADAHDVFVRHGLLMAKPTVNLIYTIPIFTFYSPDADAISAQFDATLSLPMLKVIDLQGDKAAGYQAVEAIIAKRVAPGILDPDALDLLIRGTGGVLRDVFEVLTTVASYIPVKREGRIKRAHIESGLGALAKDGERKDPKELYERLARIAQLQAQKTLVPPQNDPAIQLLLQSGALLEYNGQRWLGVHPMARRYLADLGYQDLGSDPYGL